MTDISSSETIANIFKSRKNLLSQLKYQGYNVSDFEDFNMHELHAMFINDQLNMTLTSIDDNKKTHVVYHISKNLRKENIDDYVNEIYNLGKIISKDDMLVIIVKSQPNDTLVDKLKYIWEKEKIFIVIHAIQRLQFNILEHDMVSPHIILTDKESEELKEKYNILDSSQMPNISRFDPVALSIGLKPDQICKIIRSSKTAIESNYYRICSQ
jgi:DNA-directed RNA polymerase subunit H (RpoH/RPB5)